MLLSLNKVHQPTNMKKRVRSLRENVDITMRTLSVCITSDTPCGSFLLLLNPMTTPNNITAWPVSLVVDSKHEPDEEWGEVKDCVSFEAWTTRFVSGWPFVCCKFALPLSLVFLIVYSRALLEVTSMVSSGSLLAKRFERRGETSGSLLLFN